MPDYVYLPYQCKRPAIDFRSLADENKSLKHVLYLGDSILRTHYCGHLWPALRNEPLDVNDPVNHICDFSDDIKGYHFADRSFTHSRSSLPLSADTISAGRDDDTAIRFSQRFVAGDINIARTHLQAMVDQGPPITHLVTNIGMWFGDNTSWDYLQHVRLFLSIVVEVLGPDVHITWLHTATTVPGINCWEHMKREVLRHHSSFANVAIDELRDHYPTLRIRAIDSFAILDHRPDAASDGR